MKKLVYIGICLLLLWGLISCKTQRGIERVEKTTKLTDTTRIASDSAVVTICEERERAVMERYTDWGHIEFANSGGVLIIDGGMLKAVGVRAYKQGNLIAREQTERDVRVKDSVGVGKYQANGIQHSIAKVERKSQKQGVQALTWRQRVFYYIGFFCCLVLIICAILSHSR